MTQAMRDEAQQWIAEAEKDLKDAEMLLRYESYYPLCRLAYLATEKAMRVLVLGKGQHVAAQSTLASLGQQVEKADPALRSLTASLRPLEQFAPPDPAGEPRGAPSAPLYGREAARQALDLARQAVTAAKRSSQPAQRDRAI